MFFHTFIYHLKRCFFSKDEIIWTLLFPFALGTLFFVSFDHLNAYTIDPFTIAVVDQYEGDAYFDEVIKACDEEEDFPFTVLYKTEEEATALLEQEEIVGYYIITDAVEAPTMVISGKETTKESIMQAVLKQYIQMKELITTAIEESLDFSSILQLLKGEMFPALEEAMEAYNRSVSIPNKYVAKDDVSIYDSFFYALISMCCLFAATAGLHGTTALMANASDVGARNCVAPTHRLTAIMGAFAASLTFHCVTLLIILIYLMGILGVNFGGNWGPVLLTGFAGNFVGVSMGYLVGSFSKLSMQSKEGLVTTLTLSCSFLSGLMLCQVKGIIEGTFPLLNRINPASLVTDCYYCLSMFEDYARFTRGIVSLFIIGIVFCAISYLLTRRVRYDSL